VIADLVIEALGQVAAGFLGDRPARRRHDDGTTRVAAAVRIPGRGWRSRWRHGDLDLRRDGSCSWAPRRLRPGRRMVLPEMRLGPYRKPSLAEHVWIDPGCRVFSATAHDLDLEIAVRPEAIEPLLAWNRARYATG
jgi:hypothetical protein